MEELTAALERRNAPSQLFSAAHTGDLDLLKRLAIALDEGDGLKKTIETIKDADGRTALHLAATGGMTPVCKYLLEEVKLDVNLKDGKGETPLHHAVWEGHLLNAVYLLKKGGNPNAKSVRGFTPLHHAAMKGFVKLLTVLIAKGAKVDEESDFGTPLQRAASKGQKEAAKFLLDNKANPNVNLCGVYSPLVLSILARSSECVKLLLQAEADPNSCSWGMTPIERAAFEGETEIIKLLLKAGANPNVTNDYGLTPVEVAAINGHHGVVRILLPKTAPISTVADWSFRGILQYVNTEEAKGQRNCKRSELFLSLKSKGEDAFKREDYIDAIFWYTQASATHPKDAAVLSNRSLCWARLNEGDDALTDAKACLMLRPNWHKAYYREGMAYMLLKNFRKAADSFKAGLKLDPENKELENAFEEALGAHLRSVHIVI